MTNKTECKDHKIIEFEGWVEDINHGEGGRPIEEQYLKFQMCPNCKFKTWGFRP